jgi:hypothetical protein
MRVYPVPSLGHLRQNYATTEAWQQECLHETITRVNPRWGTATTMVTAPRLIHVWLMKNMSQPFTVRGLGGCAEMNIVFDCDEDAELYRLTWL